jgi:hypothetical protein
MKFLCFFCFILSACNYAPTNNNITFDERTSSPPAYISPQEDTVNSNIKVTYKIINSIDSTFGYDILVDDKVFIHQPIIPSAIGNQGFKSKKDAQKVAELVMHKITLGELPPNVSVEEIEKLTLIQ